MASGFTLGELGDAAGRSLGSAQQSLTAGNPQAPTQMAIAETTLELKVAVSGTGTQALRLHPISPDQVRKGAVETAALSTVTLRFAALSAPQAAGPTEAEIGDRVRDLRETINRENLDKLGQLEIDVRHEPIAVVRDAAGRVIRTAILSTGLFKTDG